jgi:hypothetical protein
MRSVTAANRWPRLVIALALAWMVFLWYLLYLLLMKAGAQAAAVPWPSQVSFMATATPGARWGALVGVAVGEIALATAALRSRRPALWITMCAAAVQLAFVVFVGAQIVSMVAAVVAASRTIESARPVR